MRRLNGMDAMLLYSETPNLHMHTMKVAVLDASEDTGDFGFDTFRRTVEQRLPLLDPLCYRLVATPWRLHHPMWLEDCDIDLDYHLRRVRAAAPGGRRELDRLIGEIAGSPLNRDRPLWEFHFVEGLAGNRFAVIGKIHHALADGVASVNLLSRLLDVAGTDPGRSVEPPPPVTPSKTELLRTARRDHVRQLAALPGLWKNAVHGFVRVRRRARERGAQPELAKSLHAPPTFLNHVVSPARTFASTSVSLDAVKETARHLDTKINDVVLAIAAGAMRALLLHYDGAADQPIIASVPVATDASPDRVSGNELSGLPVSLPVHIADPLERVRLIRLATTIAKEDQALLGPDLYSRFMGYLPTALAPMMFRWLGERDSQNKIMNVPVSNVVGPRERGHIGGVPVSEIYSTGVLSAGVGVNITLWSYVDQLNIAVLADDRTFTDPHEATEAMVTAFAELRRATGLSDELREVSTALPSA